MSLKEAGKLLESKVYDTLQLQVNTWRFFMSFPLLSFSLIRSSIKRNPLGPLLWVAHAENALMMPPTHGAVFLIHKCCNLTYKTRVTDVMTFRVLTGQHCNKNSKLVVLCLKDSTKHLQYSLVTSIMQSLENRRYFRSLTILLNCIKDNGPSYISNLFEHHPLRYNFRNGGCNLVQPSYNNRFYHNSFTYKLSHLWNELTVLTKQSANVNIFRERLGTFNVDNFKTSGKCDYCLS